MTKERRLGRGLAALLGESEELNRSQELGLRAATVVAEPPEDQSHRRSAMVYHRLDTGANALAPSEDEPQPILRPSADTILLRIDEIDENPFQPRRDFSPAEIGSLAESLRTHDMLQPILVRRVGTRWQLISGERRLRAAIQAGWNEVPARVRDADDRLVAELAIVENLRRKDLNPIEKAMSFRRYLDQRRCTQEDLAQRLKIDRSTIANLVRLLELPKEVQTALQRGELSNGHARALLPLGDDTAQIDFARRITTEGLSVRDTERMVQEQIEAEDDPLGESAPRTGRRKRLRGNHHASLEQRLRIALGTKVEIKASATGSGQIVIHFKGHDEFERISNLLSAASS